MTGFFDSLTSLYTREALEFRACGRGGAMWASPPTKSQGVRRITMGGQSRPPETLDNGLGMGIIKIRGRCDKRSALNL